jgi:hypothetical protein
MILTLSISPSLLRSNSEQWWSYTRPICLALFMSQLKMALIVRLWKSESPFKHLSNANQKGKIYVITNITTLSFWINKGEHYLQRYNYNSLMHSHTFAALKKWKFEFTDLNKILEFIFILIFKKKRRKIYCSWAGGPMLITRTAFVKNFIVRLLLKFGIQE